MTRKKVGVTGKDEGKKGTRGVYLVRQMKEVGTRIEGEIDENQRVVAKRKKNEANRREGRYEIEVLEYHVGDEEWDVYDELGRRTQSRRQNRRGGHKQVEGWEIERRR